MKFVEFKKIPRLSRDMIITEKLDGTNGQICIIKIEELGTPIYESGKELPIHHAFNLEQSTFFENYLLAKKDDLCMFAGSRNRWLTPGKQTDNHAFATWVKENSEELFKLGEGRHFGEWYGKGIQRNYGLDHKRFALFNVNKWQNRGLKLVDDKQKYAPVPCEVVPVLYEGPFHTDLINFTLQNLKDQGSKAVPNFMNPEGIVIYHTAAGQYFKKTIKDDEKPKGLIESSAWPINYRIPDKGRL